MIPIKLEDKNKYYRKNDYHKSEPYENIFITKNEYYEKIDTWARVNAATPTRLGRHPLLSNIAHPFEGRCIPGVANAGVLHFQSCLPSRTPLNIAIPSIHYINLYVYMIIYDYISIKYICIKLKNIQDL